MEEYKRIFFELLKYANFIKDEKVNIHDFVSELTPYYSEKIKFDKPKTLEEVIRNVKYICE